MPGNGAGLRRPAYGWLLLLLTFCQAPFTPLLGQSIRPLGYDTPAYLEFQSPSFIVKESTNAVITVVRTGDYRQTVSIDYRTIARSAEENADYKETGGTLVFPAGQSYKTFEIPIIQDDLAEGPEEIQLELLNPGPNVQITRAEAILTIEETRFAAAAAPVRLSIARDGGAIVLSWPLSAGNCVLEKSAGVQNEAWIRCPTTPLQDNDRWVVREDSSTQRGFYRLVIE